MATDPGSNDRTTAAVAYLERFCEFVPEEAAGLEWSEHGADDDFGGAVTLTVWPRDPAAFRGFDLNAFYSETEVSVAEFAPGYEVVGRGALSDEPHLWLLAYLPVGAYDDEVEEFQVFFHLRLRV